MSFGRLCWVSITFATLAGCGGAGATTNASLPTSEAGGTEVTPRVGLVDQAPSSTSQALPSQRVEFQSKDGTKIAALYWPPISTPAPAVVLMHMMGGSKEDWSQLAILLQGEAVTQAGPTTEEPLSFAVLAIDFRGHGESGGSRTDRPAMIDDAGAALAFVRNLPGVNNTRIVMIGASIGGDAAVDACGEGCIGAISLSPGGFLGIPYTQGLSALGDKPVLCVASEGDQFSANTCKQGETIGLRDYQTQMYTGNAHGTQMLAITDQKPLPTDLLLAWLKGHVSTS